METRNLITFAVIAIIIFVIGGALGIVYQSQKFSSSGALAAQQTVKVLSSKVIPSIIAYGTVTDIQGRNITLAYNADSVTVAVADNANVFTFVQSSDPKATPIQTKAEFSQVKKGDNLNVSLKLLPTGVLQGTTVIILPTFNKTGN